jgi:hypothetical protein
LRLPLDEAVATIAHVLVGSMAPTPPICFKSRACSRLKATKNLKKGFTCTPANP